MMIPETSPQVPETQDQQETEERAEAKDLSTCHEMVVIIRPSFMKLCEQDACRAAVFNHILYWIARKCVGQPQEMVRSGAITYYATTDELTESLASAWGSEKVRKEANALITMGLIRRGKNKGWGADRTKHFFFGTEECAQLLSLCQKQNVCLLHIGLPDAVVHLLKLCCTHHASQNCCCPKQITDQGNANHESATCKSRITEVHSAHQGNANRESVRAITKNSPKVTTKKEKNPSETNMAVATVSTQPSLSETILRDQSQQQESASQNVTDAQATESPQGKPVMPDDTLPWGPEKMVQITECLRFCCEEQGAYFSTEKYGKKNPSERDRQVAAARRILAALPKLTEAEYIATYTEQNDDWWNRTKGSLTVEAMAADTPRKLMRTLELLEKLRTRSTSIRKQPTVPAKRSYVARPTQKELPMSHDAAQALAQTAIRDGSEHGRDIGAQVLSLDNGAWGIVVRWNTEYFEKPETIKSETRWKSALKAMVEVWQMGAKEESQQWIACMTFSQD